MTPSVVAGSSALVYRHLFAGRQCEYWRPEDKRVSEKWTRVQKCLVEDYAKALKDWKELPVWERPEGAPLSPAMQAVDSAWKSQAEKVMRSTRSWRIEEMYRNNPHLWWFFVLLTADDSHYDTVFSRGSNAFHNWIRDVGRRYGLERRHITYCAVTEVGERTGRLHIHVVLGLGLDEAGVAHRCRDPNGNVQRPYRREWKDLDGTWKYGTANAKFLRTHQGDAWAGRGFRWPLEKGPGGTWTPLKASGPSGPAKYLAKYLSKSCSALTRDVQFRTKWSRRAGLERIDALCGDLDTETLYALASYPSAWPQPKEEGKPIPTRVLRNSAARAWCQKQSDDPEQMIRMLGSILRPRPSSWRLVRDFLDDPPSSQRQVKTLFAGASRLPAISGTASSKAWWSIRHMEKPPDKLPMTAGQYDPKLLQHAEDAVRVLKVLIIEAKTLQDTSQLHPDLWRELCSLAKLYSATSPSAWQRSSTQHESSSPNSESTRMLN